MNVEEVCYWSKMYDNRLSELNEGEIRLRDRIKGKGKIGIFDLLEINRWKFKEFNYDRYVENERRILMNRDEDIKFKSMYYLNNSGLSDKERVDGLRMSGVGVSMSSVILMLYDKKRYGVFDWHVWCGVKGDKFVSKMNDYDFYRDSKYYMIVLRKLRKIAKKCNVDVRTVEKAVFMRHKYGNNKKVIVHG